MRQRRDESRGGNQPKMKWEIALNLERKRGGPNVGATLIRPPDGGRIKVGEEDLEWRKVAGPRSLLNFVARPGAGPVNAVTQRSTFFLVSMPDAIKYWTGSRDMGDWIGPGPARLSSFDALGAHC